MIENSLKNKENVQGRYIVNVLGSPSAVSVFNDLVRNPLESFLRKNPQKKIVFLIDGLDESVTSTKEESYSDFIISILSNLDALENVFFIIKTHDYENILNKFKQNSLILDISSKEYIKNIDDDISSFIKLNINKIPIFDMDKNDLEKERIINQLTEKAQGNFLYVKFVMDAILEGKIGFSENEINKIPSGLFGMYSLFFDRMVTQYGKDSWKRNYKPIIRTLSVSFEGLDFDQISFFSGIEREDLQDILINLKPFIRSFA